MCWNREVSIVTGSSASILSIYLLIFGKGNDIPIGLVSLAIALMQFAEAFMWEAWESKQKSSIGSQLGLIALFLQPLVLGLGIAWTRNAPYWVFFGFVFIWAVLAFPTLLPLLHQTWPIQPGCKGHLQWSFLDPMLQSPFAILYWAVMLGGWLLLKPLAEGINYSIIALVTLFVTWFFFPGEWGSLWCFLANALPIGRLL